VLGESVSEATVGAWLKQTGQAVVRDEPLVELETDKVSVEVAAAEDGVLSEIFARRGEMVGMGAVLGRIGLIVPAVSSRDNDSDTSAPNKLSQPAAPNAVLTQAGAVMDIKVPVMGESVTEGTLANWLVKPGQTVAQDDPIAEIETDKVAIEVPSPAAGVISETLVKEGETVAIGTIIARMTTGAGAAKSAASAALPAPVVMRAMMRNGSGSRCE